ncbi:MAG: AraC family transcriptional regulator [Firmicutes bacterium]|nr:AraC family transcriptional regulator [Bacillota bacterium]
MAREINNIDNAMAPAMSLMLYFCGWECCRPSHSFGPAVRQHYLIHVVSKGRGTYYVRDKAYPVEKGQMFLIRPGESTYYEADATDPWDYCWMGFDGYEVKNILARCGFTNDILVKNDPSDGLLTEALFEMISCFDQGKINEYSILSRMYQIFSLMLPGDLPNIASVSQRYLTNAIEYIQNNYSYPIRISDISRQIGIDRTYLYKLFMDYHHTSPQQYLIHYRLNTARKMLEENHLSITEIVYSCGFKDSPSFYKHFKKLFGITPAKYRKTIHK